MKPKLSILIATIGERNERFMKLLAKIMSQAEKHGNKIEVLAYWNNGERPMAEIRQTLVDEAFGEYVCFVDDDDDLPDYYCDEIIKATEKNPDYVGWQQQLWHNGEKMKPTFHSIKYEKWSEDDNGWYRDISHLNPIKRDIALKVKFGTPKGEAEDAPWASRIRPLIKTEEYIPKVMYHYIHNQLDSKWRGDVSVGYTRPEVNYKNFRFV